MSKEKIFALLSAQAGDFVSGEDISAQLGISRAAVWKAVGALRRDGYTIEAQTGLGYRLADSPDVLSERELRRRSLEKDDIFLFSANDSGTITLILKDTKEDSGR